jgi:hypothetical protein
VDVPVGGQQRQTAGAGRFSGDLAGSLHGDCRQSVVGECVADAAPVGLGIRGKFAAVQDRRLT